MVWRSGSSAPSRSRSCGAGSSAMPRRFAPPSGPSSRAITSPGCWRRMPTAALLRPGANGSPHAPQYGRPHSSILCSENPGRYNRITRDLDDNEQAQRRSQAEQDGSEVRSVDLERLIAQGLTLTERRNAFEFLRDHAAEHYAAHTGSAWRPRSGSMVNHRALTAAVIDSRDFLNAKRRAETEVLLPPGPRIAFAGGIDYNDHARIWAALDQAREKHPAMVLMHGGSPKGAERIAACWADQRQVPQVAFKPDWTRHKNAAPFKRNDQMLEAVPIGVLLFPGSGISENLADKARKMGIPVKRFVPKDGAA